MVKCIQNCTVKYMIKCMQNYIIIVKFMQSCTIIVKYVVDSQWLYANYMLNASMRITCSMALCELHAQWLYANYTLNGSMQITCSMPLCKLQSCIGGIRGP